MRDRVSLKIRTDVAAGLSNSVLAETTSREMHAISFITNETHTVRLQDCWTHSTALYKWLPSVLCWTFDLLLSFQDCFPFWQFCPFYYSLAKSILHPLASSPPSKFQCYLLLKINLALLSRGCRGQHFKNCKPWNSCSMWVCALLHLHLE